jgi:hypothetical protein
MVIEIVREDETRKLVGCDSYILEQYALKTLTGNADNQKIIKIYPLVDIREIVIPYIE